MGKIPTLWQTMAAFLVLHIGLMLAVPLIEDEAYYTLWASAPAFGYYDHPPMIAWWIWLGETILGANRVGIRVFSVLGFWLVTAIVWRIAYLISGQRRSANIAALWYNSTVLIFSVGFVATPDAPSVFFWAAALWALVEIIPRSGTNAGPGSTISTGKWWLLAGAFIAFGINAKFTNLFLLASLCLWVVATPLGRKQLRNPMAWGGALTTVILLVPLIWWNYTNDWLGLERQFGRIDQAGTRYFWIFDYIATTPLLLSPPIAWFALKGLRQSGQAHTLLRWLTLPLMAFMIYHASSAPVAGNWLAPLYASLSVFAALGAGQINTKIVWQVALSGLVLSALALGVVFWPGTPLVAGNIPPNQTKGWTNLITELETIAQKNDVEWIATLSYGLTGQLSVFVAQYPTWSLRQQERYGFRGPFPTQLCTAPALLVLRERESDFAPENYFQTTGPVQELTRYSNGAPIERYTVRPVQFVGSAGPASCQSD